MASASRIPNSLEHGTAQKAVGDYGWTPRLIDTAYRIMTDSTNDDQHPHPNGLFQDPSTDSGAHASPIPPTSGACTSFLLSHDAGLIKNRVHEQTEEHTSVLKTYQDNTPRTKSYTTNAPSCNRGTPLATISEQGSASSFKSQGSVFGGNRFPSIRANENTSPGRTIARTPHGDILKRTKEETYVEGDGSPRIFINDQQMERYTSDSDLLGVVARSRSSADLEHCQPGILRLTEDEQPSHDTLGYCMPDTVQRTTHGPHPFPFPVTLTRFRSWFRSRASTAKDIPDVHALTNPTDPGHPSQSHICQSSNLHVICADREEQPVPGSLEFTGRNASPSLSAGLPSHARSRKSQGRGPGPMAEVDTPGLPDVPHAHSQNVDSCSHTNPLLFPSLSNFKYGGEVDTNSRSVPPNPCDVTPEHVLAKATALAQDGRDGRLDCSVVDCTPSGRPEAFP